MKQQVNNCLCNSRKSSVYEIAVKTSVYEIAGISSVYKVTGSSSVYKVTGTSSVIMKYQVFSIFFIFTQTNTGELFNLTKHFSFWNQLEHVEQLKLGWATDPLPSSVPRAQGSIYLWYVQMCRTLECCHTGTTVSQHQVLLGGMALASAEDQHTFY